LSDGAAWFQASDEDQAAGARLTVGHAASIGSHEITNLACSPRSPNACAA
jgi:hypothetical protein